MSNWNNVNVRAYVCCEIILELQTMYLLFHIRINYMLNKNQHANKDVHRSGVCSYSECLFGSLNISFDPDVAAKWGTMIMALTTAESMESRPDV